MSWKTGDEAYEAANVLCREFKYVLYLMVPIVDLYLHFLNPL